MNNLIEKALFIPSLGWDTLAGAIGFIIVAFILWKVNKAILKETNRQNEIEVRKEGQEFLNKANESGKTSTDILRELLKKRKK